MHAAATLDLSALGAGFAEPALDSQSVFRDCLDALAHPGKLQKVSVQADWPAGVHPAAGAVLLALLDQDTQLWLSPSLRSGAAPGWLRFHTGCTLTEMPDEADFALVAAPQELPDLAGFRQGSEAFPDRSTTLVVQCAHLLDADTEGAGWRLSGPGLRARTRLQAGGLDETFRTQWARNRKAFPCGIDVFLASGSTLAALPRTTRLEA